MRLTHIKLAGFKSFTDSTTIHVPGRLVAVIGPNGCGKSNVIDAVRWVLGEASAKQLRGESMQDIIFNGAATRRPAPRASVELVFSNADGSLQGAWGQYGEISIRRQLTRQGESSYYINGQQVRRRDITDLFLGTGVGARGYAVIEQGMIARIIEARPEELRAHIEEAAGVSKYKERRRETENRLQDTREHLQRLGDLQAELTRQVEKLQRQAAAAERYRSLTAELNHAQNQYDFQQWRHTLAAADQSAAEHQRARTRQDELARQNQALGDAVHMLRQTEQDQQAEQYRLNQQHALLREQSARLEEQIRSRQSQRQRLEREQANAQTAIQKIDSEHAELRQQHAAAAQAAAEHQAQFELLAAEADTLEEQLPALENAGRQAAEQQQSRRDEAARLRRELALKQQQLQHSRQNIGRLQERHGRLQQEAAALASADSAAPAAVQAHTEALAGQYQRGEQQLQQLEEQTGYLKTALQAAREREQEHEHRILAAQAEQKTLAALLAEQSGHDFWQGSSQAEAPALWQHIRVPSEWQGALAAVLGERLNARALPADFQPPSPLPEAAAAWFSREAHAHRGASPAQALIHQIQAEPPFQVALTHWLEGILCAPDLDYALAHRSRLEPGQEWLTPQGHRIDRLGVLLHHEANAGRQMRHQTRHDQLAAQLAEWQPKFQVAQTEARKLARQQAEAEAALRQAQSEQRRLTAELAAARQQAGEQIARATQERQRREHIAQEQAQLAQEIEELGIAAELLAEENAALEESLPELEESSREQAEHSRQAQQALRQAQQAVLEAARRRNAAEIEAQRQQQQLQYLNSRMAALAQQKADWQQRQHELALTYAEDSEDEQRLQLEALTESAFALEEQMQAAAARLAATQEQGREQYARQQALAAELPQWQAAAQTALLQQQEALLNAKHFHDNLLGRQADLAALEAEQQAGYLKTDWPQQIDSLSRRIQALGAVNLAALEELAEARERDGYYQNQRQDLQSAIALLEEAIAQIDGETKQRFQATFNAVNQKVQTFFPTLFGGGEASLHMVGDDLLSAGVSIMARPPGKKNSTIHLLSGGEKALTAMSLVFALFSLNPAPFCLLDEVDAPLDDANTGRFCRLVKEMSAQTQFLYISHNRLTMEMAEQLIGVTMQEKGVSRIVAVDIKQALEMAETD
ncbi:chromosome segregation protein SMC [Eikenella sp. S3360]|uniref:Chromosome partition protein Smc n=1 Tax=Eikenella glucosivorans TaxID=2766967 RepID=A0ABS0N969_9NEIS|nr:chromosome segregation protein SMC [Eikenella glucosivorans]MBH5328831.1 chromosome segregation protein SMC [Eikenella glucosivorans]